MLNEIIREGNVEKYYYTLAKGKIKDGLYTGYILKNENENISKIYEKRFQILKEIAMEVKNSTNKWSIFIFRNKPYYRKKPSNKSSFILFRSTSNWRQ